MRTHNLLPHSGAHGSPAPPAPAGVFFPLVDLRADCAQVARLWNDGRAPRVPLPLAAAFTFHRTRRGGDERLSRTEYAHALDIAAVALSCLIPIYTLDAAGERFAVAIDLSLQRFRGGAAEVLGADGALLAPLGVDRRDVLAALRSIGHAGIDIHFVAPRPAAK